MKYLFNIVALILLIQNPVCAQFKGKVIVEWLEQDGDDRLMELKEDFSFTSPTGKHWTVPKGAIIDGASIPKIFWNSIGPPFVGDYRYASVVHDYYCQTKTETWEDTHKVFYEASIASGVSNSKAKLMYAAIYGWGPRWKVRIIKGLEDETRVVIDEEPPFFDEAEFKEIQNIILRDTLSLEGIERYIEERSKK